MEALRVAGYRLIGPTVRDGAISYGEIRTSSELPVGWGDQQSPGAYRLQRRGDDAVFGFAAPAESFKPFFYTRSERLVTLRRHANDVTVAENEEVHSPLALFGARACDLAGLENQDRILISSDPHYTARRRNTFVVAVNCSVAASTCFCTSMGTGPRPVSRYDLCLTEVTGNGEHRFVVEIGSEQGRELLERVESERAPPRDCASILETAERTVASMRRRLDTKGIRDLLYGNLEHPRWDDVAARCLSCTNCTMVCPTCFCGAVDDEASLDEEEIHRVRIWDSCFTASHSELHGNPVRESIRARYRQWLTHKLAGWIDQFGSSGCVGCGRCIAWCPAGIDLTEEVAAIRGSPAEDASLPGNSS
jgi:sulfhydrogenase subunit beta (sulfur reductase)